MAKRVTRVVGKVIGIPGDGSLELLARFVDESTQAINNYNESLDNAPGLNGGDWYTSVKASVTGHDLPAALVP